MEAPEPPRRAESWLRLLLPSGARGDAVLGDLREEYANKVAADGYGRARWWYRREAIALATRYARERLVRLLRWADGWRDLRRGARSLLRDPSFTVATAGVLAIGIGAATAAFTLSDRVLLQRLPYADESRVVSVYESDARGASRPLSYPTFRDWQPEALSFERLAFVRGEQLGVHGPDGTWLLAASYGTGDLFTVLGARPVLGRVFAAEESREPVAVLAWHTWREQFGGDPAVVGRELSTGHGPVTVIGVMPEDVRYPAWSDVWLPLGTLPRPSLEALERRDLHADSGVVGRLRGDATLDRATLELSGLAERHAAIHPDARGWTRATLRTLRDELVGPNRGRLLAVISAAVLLLLVAGVNVAGLLVARTAARRRELAVRVALGATPGRLAIPLIAESLIVAVMAAAAGAAIAAVIVRALAALAPDALPRLDGASVNLRALLFALGASLVLAIAFALMTARRAKRIAPMEALRSGRAASGGPGVQRLRSGLVVAEIALAALLVVGATTLVQALVRLGAVDLGLDPDGVVAVQIMPPSPRYDTAESALMLYRRLETAARAVPGVRTAALVNHLPLTRGAVPTTLRTTRVPEADEQPRALYRSISSDYFATLGIAIVRGRAPTAAEIDAAAPVVVVNAALARREWPDRDPVGETITVSRAAQARPDFGEEVTLTVIGVAASTRSFGPANDPPPAVYVPYPLSVWGHTYVVARGDGDVGVLAEGLRRALLDVDPTLPLAGPAAARSRTMAGFSGRVRPLTDFGSSWLRAERVGAGMVSGFAVASFVLATVGLFGMVSYVVLLRRREFGVRLALGATRGAVVRQVMRYGVRLTSVGLGVGFAGALVAVRIFDATTLSVPPPPLGACIVTAATFALAVMTACVTPALRAARADPASVLRDDG